MNAADGSSFYDLCSGNFVLPSHVEKSAGAAQKEMIELLGVSAVDSPGLAGVEESGQYHCTVNLRLTGEADASPFPDILTESSEGDAGLSNPTVDFSMYTTLDSVLPDKFCPLTVTCGSL